MSVSLVGGILMLVGGGMYWARGKQAAKLQDIREARSATIGELQGLADAVAEDIGRGSWSEYVKVAGKITGGRALSSPLTNRPCVQYKVTVTREYEYEEERTDSHGHRHCETKRGSECVSSQHEAIPFGLKDRTGTCTVIAAGAEVELSCSLDEFKREPNCYGLHWDGGHGHGHGHHERKTLGYKYHEEILPVDRQVLVVAQAADGPDGLVLKKPAKKDDSMIVSLQTEEALKAATASSAQWLGYGAVACGALGVVMLIGGLFTGPSSSHHSPSKRRRHAELPPPVVATVPAPAHLL